EHEELAELRLLRGDPDVGHQGQLHAPADGGAVDSGDDRDVRVQERVGRRGEGRLAALPAGRGVVGDGGHHLLHVVARAEGRVGAGDDEAAGGRRANRLLEIPVGRERQRVAGLWTLERDDPHVPELLVGQLGRHARDGTGGLGGVRGGTARGSGRTARV